MRPLEVDEADRRRLRAMGRAPDAPWWVRDRVEMVLLASEGWSALRIARHLGCHPDTVRRTLRRYRQVGTDALERALPGPAPDFVHQRRVAHALEVLLAQPRTWTAAQLSEALRPHRIRLSARQVRRYLTAMGAHWARTKMSLAHLQDPDAVARARAQLFRLKKKPVQDKSTSTS